MYKTHSPLIIIINCRFKPKRGVHLRSSKKSTLAMVDCVGGLTKITENIVKGTTHFHSKMYKIAFQYVYNKK